MREEPRQSFLFNPQARQHRTERRAFWAFRVATYLIVLAASWIFLDIFIKGSQTLLQAEFPFINITFLTDVPQTLHVFEYEGEILEMADREFRQWAALKGVDPDGYPTDTYAHSGGGIFPAIIGTILLVTGAMTIALVLGIFSAIYLSEYASDTRFIRIIRLSILNLAGVPSVVFGLFGFGMFVLFFDFGVSLISGWFTLAFMVLPIVITASEESLRAVPQGFREGSLALGATKWQSIRTNVLPYALPGILTSSVLSVARVAGETAPIMFTAAVIIRDRLPWQVESLGDFFTQAVMALPYHIYVVSSRIPQNEYTARMQYGTAFVFLFLVAAIAMISIIMRARARNRYKW